MRKQSRLPNQGIAFVFYLVGCFLQIATLVQEFVELCLFSLHSGDLVNEIVGPSKITPELIARIREMVETRLDEVVSADPIKWAGAQKYLEGRREPS